MKEESGKAIRKKGRDKDMDSSTANSSSRMPRNSLLYEKLVPAMLAFFGLLTVGMIVFAIAVLLGLVSY